MTGFAAQDGQKGGATLNVEDWPLARVIPYHQNPRINVGAVAKVAASLKRFGWRQPLVVDADGVLIVGHTRRLAALSLGWVRAPVHVAADMPPADVKAYRLADNRTGEEAEWDDALLGLEFAELRGMDFDLGLTGFEPTEIKDFLGIADTLSNAAAFGALPTGERSPFEQMTFTLNSDQADTVREALEAAKAKGPFADTNNENSNGNALTRVAEFALGALR